jgi:subtilisin family serine protease
MRGRRNRPSLAVALLAGCLLAAFLVGASVCTPSTQRGSAVTLDNSQSLDAVPGEILVKFKELATATAQSPLLQMLGSPELGRIEGLDIVRIGLKPNISIEEAVRLYKAQPEVEYAEPNYILHTDGIPNDPLYAGRQQWYYDLIQAPAGWDIETGKPSVIVAVLDTGVDIRHPDLDNFWTNPGEIADNNKDDDGNGCVDDIHGCSFADSTSPSCHYKSTPNNTIADDVGHGTFISGIIAAATNNQIGVAGTAPGVTIMPVKVLDCTGAGTVASAAKGVLYAAQAGADVINISFGGEYESAVLADALRQAHDTFGAVIVSSAGNAGKAGVSFPARFEKVIAVSASDHNNPDGKASFSNWGPEVAVTAPGVDIVSTVPQQLCNKLWTCIANQPYAVGSGTSFSTPLVSAAAALILSRNPVMTPEEVTKQLTSTALDIPDGAFPHWDGSGRIQIDKALQSGVYRVGVSGVTKN